LVILGWGIDQPMTLHFETFETVVFFLSVLVVTYVIQDGKSNYLEGAMVSLRSIFAAEAVLTSIVTRPIRNYCTCLLGISR